MERFISHHEDRRTDVLYVKLKHQIGKSTTLKENRFTKVYEDRINNASFVTLKSKSGGTYIWRLYINLY